MRTLNTIAALCLGATLMSPTAVLGLTVFGDGDTVWEKSANVYVKFAEQDSTRFGANDHPVELDEAQVRAALTALRTVDRKNAEDDFDDESEDTKRQKRDALRVFSKKQAATLARHLVRGLRQATPQLDLVFSIDREQPRPLGMRPEIFFTAGRAFFKDNRLNIILGDHERPQLKGYEKAYDPTGVGIVHYRFAYGSRDERTGSFDKTIQPLGGVQFMAEGGEPRNDWLLIDLPATIASLSTQQQATADAEREAKRRELMELLDERDRALLEQRSQQGYQQAAPVPVVPVPAPQYPPGQYPPGQYPPQYAPPGYPPQYPPVAPAVYPPPIPGGAMHPVEERLTVLKRLKDRGLITEAEYDKKRKELINEL